MDKQEKKERAHKDAILEGLPPINIGALFMPPIWGPAHGIWITILYYPMWLFADNLFYAAYSNPAPLPIIGAIVVGVVLAFVTIMFARISQGWACERALSRGMSKEAYVKRQRIWAWASIALAVIMLAAATYYNLVIRPTIGG